MRLRICDECGANLDPGERCDCKDEQKKKIRYIENYIAENFEKRKDGQMQFVL